MNSMCIGPPSHPHNRTNIRLMSGRCRAQGHGLRLLIMLPVKAHYTSMFSTALHHFFPCLLFCLLPLLSYCFSLPCSLLFIVSPIYCYILCHPVLSAVITIHCIQQELECPSIPYHNLIIFITIILFNLHGSIIEAPLPHLSSLFTLLQCHLRCL
jgi:hypothetical protein